jgi:molybdate transport system regulatory protein
MRTTRRSSAGKAGPGRRLRLRVVLREGAALGPGKIDLLEAITESGSIRAAGNRFKMSYRRAWELVAELNRMFSGPLVKAETGGRGGGGAALTPLGAKVAARYRAMETKAWAAVAADYRALVAELGKDETA